MARDYKITEIVSYETDSSGYIRVEFRIKDDPKNMVRLIEDTTYLDWVESLSSNRSYNSESWGADYYDDEFGQSHNPFDFDSWKDENEDDSIIKKFVYENFTITTLPDPEEI
jgi:hypothetical protein